ncbi:hypothetical protein D3C87_1129220 [compost metagenome]
MTQNHFDSSKVKQGYKKSVLLESLAVPDSNALLSIFFQRLSKGRRPEGKEQYDISRKSLSPTQLRKLHSRWHFPCEERVKSTKSPVSRKTRLANQVSQLKNQSPKGERTELNKPTCGFYPKIGDDE